mmetsp:Transcript_9013/g.8415  ORF Transcript_9013/g.8415 Transcript_9013/m.8415 type:complete len:239 (+) Transcript_9013:48-764(+)
MNKDGGGLNHLDKTSKVLEPWQILLDLGHFASYNYNYLLNSMQEFKEMNEKMMARILLNLSVNHTGYDDPTSRVVQTLFEANKKGTAPQFKDQNDKKMGMIWSVDNLSRLFRELYSNLNWLKVFEALSELDEQIMLDNKGFSFFLAIFNKSKPQNLAFPLNLVLDREWAQPSLQLNFIENCVQTYLEKKDKTINFLKLPQRQEVIEELQGIKDRASQEMQHVWQSIQLCQRLIEISNT